VEASGNTEWAIRLAILHREQPLLSLKDALLPTFTLFRNKIPEHYKDFTDEDFFKIIDGASAKMTLQLERMNLEGIYPVDMATGINIFTKESPPWYWLMSTAFNDVQSRGQGSRGSSDDVSACLPFSKFLKNALEHLPDEFHHQGSVMRGSPWVYPSPLDHDPEKHFVDGQEIVMYSWKSATTEVNMVQQQEQFCGRQGLRTMFKIEAGSISYKISDFSDFPNEFEVLIPILARFIVKSVVKLITVKLTGQETDSSVCESDFRNSPEHTGDPDIVVLKPV